MPHFSQILPTFWITRDKVIDYDPRDVAELFIEGNHFQWYHRVPRGTVREVEGRVGPVVIKHFYRWMVPQTLQSTLQDEVDIDLSRIIPTDDDIPDDAVWTNRFSPTGPDPEEWTDRITRSLLEECLEAGVLNYKSVEMLRLFKEEDGSACEHCGFALCLWKANSQSIVDDNNRFRPGATNKQKRFFAYKQLTFVLHGPLPKGNRQQLPKCTVDGIRDAWPEQSDSLYTGFKEAK